MTDVTVPTWWREGGLRFMEERAKKMLLHQPSAGTLPAAAAEEGAAAQEEKAAEDTETAEAAKQKPEKKKT